MHFRSLIALALLYSGAIQAAPSYPLQVSADGRRLVDQAGQAVFFNGDTPWHIITRLTREQSEQYLNDRQEHGFNALLLAVLVHESYLSGSADNIYGEGPFLTPDDFSTPNDAYFQHVDWFVDAAAARGMTLFFFPAYIGWGCQIEGWCSVMEDNGPTVLRQYGRYLGNRYKNDPNIVWVHGGDAGAGAHGSMDVVDAIAEGILEVDSDHLHTGHCNRFNSALDCYDRPWLDINNTYADCSTTAAEVKLDYNRPTTMPFFYIEGRYEFESNWTDQCMRAQAYLSLLGGAMGHFFGSGTIWDFPSGWQNSLDSQGAASMLHFGRLLLSRRWDNLVPDYSHTTLTVGYGDINTADYAAAARTQFGNSVIVYTPTRRTLTVAMNRIAGTEAKAWWFNPATGVATPIGDFPTTGSRNFDPPSNQDWVLVLDSATLNVAPPGQGVLGVPVEPKSMGALKGLFGL